MDPFLQSDEESGSIVKSVLPRSDNIGIIIVSEGFLICQLFHDYPKLFPCLTQGLQARQVQILLCRVRGGMSIQYFSN